MSGLRQSKILVTVPTGDGWIHRMVVKVLTALAVDPRVTIETPVGRPLEHNQAMIMQRVMSGGFDWWVSIDADNPPMKNPLELTALDLDIVGCPTPIWHNNDVKAGEFPIYWNALVEDGSGYRQLPMARRAGLQQVDAVGGGCWAVSRRVLEALIDEAPFQRIWNADGTVEFGNDFAFCRRAKAKGFKVWAHFDYPCEHILTIGGIELLQAIERAWPAEGD